MHGSVAMPVDLNSLRERIRKCQAHLSLQQAKVIQFQEQAETAKKQIQSEYGVAPENISQELARVDQEIQTLQAQISKSLSDIGY